MPGTVNQDASKVPEPFQVSVNASNLEQYFNLIL